MHLLGKTPQILSQLQAFDTFEGVAASSLQWLIDAFERRFSQEGEYSSMCGI